MSSTIALTQANCTNPTSGSNTFVYQFPTSVTFADHSIALQSVATPYSWFSITEALGNNVFTMTVYPDDAWAHTYTITIPDGAYEIIQLNSYFQYWSLANGLYMINTQSVYV